MMEYQNFFAGNEWKSLSVQQMIDCSYGLSVAGLDNSELKGCNGSHGYTIVKEYTGKHGVVTEKEYPYTMRDQNSLKDKDHGECKKDVIDASQDKVKTISNWDVVK